MSKDKTSTPFIPWSFNLIGFQCVDHFESLKFLHLTEVFSFGLLR